jgi:predicted nucleotide-binding protein
MKMSSTNEHFSQAGLEEFLRFVPNLSQVLGVAENATAHFGYFLMERSGVRDITPKLIRACFDAAAVAAPSNISYTMKKSRAFVRTTGGTQLSRDARTGIENSLISRPELQPGQSIQTQESPVLEKARNVVVVHGRDKVIRDSMFQFLRALHLNPREWNQAVTQTGQASPYTGEIVEKLFEDAQAIVVLLTPDERVRLREDLAVNKSADDEGWQPRPNVFVEAGKALERDEVHTVLVKIGPVRIPSDLHGRNLVNLDDSSEQRHTLVQRLLAAGCAAQTAGADWLSTGRFKISLRRPKTRRRKRNEDRRPEKRVFR